MIMKFNEILRRYHVSPLKYEDGTELEEKDYRELYKILSKYYYIRGELYKGDERLIRRLDSNVKNAIIPLEPEEQMDVLMEIDNEVIK